jgi:hypothetical protein
MRSKGFSVNASLIDIRAARTAPFDAVDLRLPDNSLGGGFNDDGSLGIVMTDREHWSLATKR